MIDALANFHFLRPAWLLLLLALPPLAWWLVRRFDTPAALARLVDARLLPHLLDATGQPRRWPLLVPVLAWLLATLALAGPAWERLPQPLYGHRSAQVVALSLSPRMLARDVAPNRLARARYKVLDLFAANRDGQNGLVAYAGAAFVVAPLTADADALTELLDGLAPDVMPVAGDNAAQAIERGVALLQRGGSGGGSLVLVTDAVGAAAVGAARRARDAGVRVSVLGVGDTRGAPVPQPGGGFLDDAAGNIVMARRDDAGLGAVAAAGGGRYVRMRADHADIDALAAELHVGTGNAPVTHADVTQWRDRGAWLLLPLLPLALLGFRRGWLLVLPLLLALPLLPMPARAADPASATSATVPPSAVAAVPAAGRWNTLWRTPDQRAAQALADGHAREAARLARDPALRGTAAYRAGDYAEAAKAFAAAGQDGRSSGDADYNLGNALARQGQYREALAAYARALSADPRNADAAANRKAVEDWMRRQPSSRSPSPGMQGSGRQGGTGSSASPQASAPQDPSAGDKPRDGSDSPTQPATGADGQKGTSTNGGRGQQAPDDAGTRAADAESAARAGEKVEQARKAVKEQMDQALGQPGRGDAPYALGSGPARAGSSGDTLPAAMQQALQRVPDDPGGLLRRKFQLEYQRRQSGGGPP
jgi:Ca-activated chloride channel family protein